MFGKGLRLKQITDGLSNTLMVGEKHVPMTQLPKASYDCSIYDGHNFLCNCRSAGVKYPLAQSIKDTGLVFGSWHKFIVQFAYCDGTVRVLGIDIDPKTLELLANVNDDQDIPDYNGRQ